MKIPSRCQIFDAPVPIDSKDVERLQPHLTNWKYLNEVFLLGVTAPDLRRLVVLELRTRGRMSILHRLLGRLAKVQRQEYLQRIRRALQ